MTIKTKFVAVPMLLLAAATANAGKGGSAAAITSAVASGSQDAIIAEVERAEGLLCDECIEAVTRLTEDNRYAVREVAGWWFAKRPGLAAMLAEQMKADLVERAGSIAVRNAADFLGAIRAYSSLPELRGTMSRSDLSSEAKLAVVRAAGVMAHKSGNAILSAGMADADPTVRVAAVADWRDVLHQTTAAPVVARLSDSDARVRAEAATVVGAYRDGNARAALEALVTGDADATVRRNAAYALGKIGSPDSRAALTIAAADKSPIVKNVAKAALASLPQK